MQTKEKSAADLALEIESLLAENAALREQLQLLSEQVAYLTKNVFGRKSERWTQAGQLDFFRKGAAAAECAALELVPVVKTKAKKKKGAHGRGSLPAHLERITHVIDLPEDAKCCSICEALLQDMGEEITERATLIPAHLVVNRYVRKKAGCPHGHEVRTADLPDGVIAGSKYDSSVLAHVAVAKYNDHRVPRRHVHEPSGNLSVPCCTEDEGRSLGVGVQALASNRLELRGSRAQVVSVKGKGAARLRQVGSKETNASEPLMTCRDVSTQRQNRAGWLARDESRGCLSTDWMAFGMKVA